MRVLVIETATAACSVALIEDGGVVASDHATVGRGHAERLLPMIAALPTGGRCDAIRVDIGPGSFTGLRVGIAAARALGFAWDIPVRGYSSLALLAAIDGWQAETTVAIEGGHGEVFVACYDDHPLREVQAARSVPFDVAVTTLKTARLVGSAARRLVDAGVAAVAHDVAIDARGLLLMPSAMSDLPPVPFYGRSPDAKPMAVA